MKEYLTYKDLMAYELAGINEISADFPINRFPQEKKEIVEEKDNICQNENLDNISNLDELLNVIKNFDKCYLKKTATNTVFGSGNPNAKIMFIGDAPGTDEDKQGVPFVGKNGDLLDKMLASIGLSREENCYITNIIPWRPPGNRAPSALEVMTCLPFIKKHIEIINPDIIVFMGGQALNALIPGNQAITKARGQWFDYTIEKTGKKIKALATYHPAFLLRSPIQKKNAWLDLLSLQEAINKD